MEITPKKFEFDANRFNVDDEEDFELIDDKESEPDDDSEEPEFINDEDEEYDEDDEEDGEDEEEDTSRFSKKELKDIRNVGEMMKDIGVEVEHTVNVSEQSGRDNVLIDELAATDGMLMDNIAVDVVKKQASNSSTPRATAPLLPQVLSGSIYSLFTGAPGYTYYIPAAPVRPGLPVLTISTSMDKDIDHRISPAGCGWVNPEPEWQSQYPHSSRLSTLVREEYLPIDERDVQALRFIARFPYVTPWVLAYRVGVTIRDMMIRLGLYLRASFVQETRYLGGPQYTITATGWRYLGLPGKKPMKRDNSVTRLYHDLAIAQIAAIAERGDQNPINENLPPVTNQPDEFYWYLDGKKKTVATAPGAWGGPPRPEEIARPRPGEFIISEQQINSGKNKQFASSADAVPFKRRRDAEIEAWVNDGMQGLTPELREGNEGYLIAVSDKRIPISNAIAVGSYSVPDLVLGRQRNADGTPASISIEVEMNRKQNSTYYQGKLYNTLMQNIYQSVHYFTPHYKIARNIARAAIDIAKAYPNLGIDGRVVIHQLSTSVGIDRLMMRE